MNQNYIILGGVVLAFYLYKMIMGRINYGKLVQLIDGDEEVHIVDVRTAGEFQSGHIPGAKNIPLSNLDKGIKKLNRESQVVLYCQSGSRASNALSTLKGSGFSKAWNFGGISRWRGPLTS